MTSPVTIIIDENLTQADIALEIEADPNDSNSLLVSYDNQPLPDTSNQESLLVDCTIGQSVRFVVADFDEPTGQTWTLAVSPLTRDPAGGSWPRNGATSYDEDNVAWPHGEDYLSVTLTATTQTATGQTQTRKRVIRVKILTGDPMPGTIAAPEQPAE